jgi:hypothetical protein
MKNLKDIADVILTTRQIGELLQISPQYLSQLERTGRIKRLGPNQWPLLGTTQSYVRSLKESRQHDNSDACADLCEPSWAPCLNAAPETRMNSDDWRQRLTAL